ncbi:RNA-binding protein FUS-like [Solea solea]|uniref:RNA-binding protein FUS-like n=1 Tax=Solea solea TaxID=90069 RepID=UPI00272C93A3|nr:RNA-binding protein FUS-like [Solea solea]
MKLNSPSVLCLSLILLYTHSSLAKKIGGGFGKIFSSKKFPTWYRGNSHTFTKTGHKNNQGSRSVGGYLKQPGQNPQGGRPGQYPVQGSPIGRGHRNQGGYPGGYVNQNPNNKILSPRYGGSFGYGGYGGGGGGGSPFSHSVQAMGVHPQDKSRGFGRSGVMAVAGGAMAGMALGYGLARFPRPHFNFHSPEEEYYYNHYMYRRYGVRSTDTNDYSRDYKYSQPTETYDDFMDSCMKRTDLLPGENPKPNSATTTVITTDPGSNSTAAGDHLTSAPTSPNPLQESEARPDEDDDDTVSIEEIGYPALIEQMKARKCLEIYMVYSEKYLMRQSSGVQGLKMSLGGFLSMVSSVAVMLLTSN